MPEIVAYIFANLPTVFLVALAIKFVVDAGFYAIIFDIASEFLNKKPAVIDTVEPSSADRSVASPSPARKVAKKPKPSENTKPVVESYSDEYKLPANPFE